MDQIQERIEIALEKLLNVTEESSKLRKDLKDNIHWSVSEINECFLLLQTECEVNCNKISDLKKEVKTQLEINKLLTATSCQGAPSAGGPREYESSQGRSTGKQSTTAFLGQVETSIGRSHDGNMKYSDVVKGNLSNVNEEKTYKLFVKSKNNQSPEYIKTLVKTKVNPVQMKVGVKTCKALKNGKILIEASNKNETEVICQKINETCGEELEAVMGKKLNPRIIIFDVGKDITKENAKEVLTSQNEEMQNHEEEVKPIFDFLDRNKNRNLVVEINSAVRNQILNKKIKCGWNICNWADYLKVSRCFKCSKYNHRALNCRGKQTCPRCTGEHTLRDCSAKEENYKCINCITYAKYNKDSAIDVNHAALDENCPCYQTTLRKYRLNIDF